ncbi:MAG TPA: hypothetical protein VFD70_16225 [Anaerolineae bacterium]|nr:hypothetical protein [Anaerolineae bacterium]
MEHIKTAISIQKSLFDQAEALAHKMKISRSRLFVLALEDYMRRQQNRDLLAQINAAYGDEPDASEKKFLRKARKQYSKLVEREW